MQIIGLLGGVASGKSLVAQRFVQLGAGLLDADRAGHEVLQLSHVEEAARKHWGDGIFGNDGRIDRTRLAKIVFAPEPFGPPERKYLESITHAEIGRLLQKQAETFASEGKKVVILDAPLLLEAGWADWCDKLVYVDSTREVRLERALVRGWSKEDFAAREGVQELLERKRSKADAIIDNSGPLERTQAQIERFWASLIR